MIKVGTKVKIIQLPEDVEDSVREYIGSIGEVKSYSSHSILGQPGFYVEFPDKDTKRFYIEEVEIIND